MKCFLTKQIFIHHSVINGRADIAYAACGTGRMVSMMAGLVRRGRTQDSFPFDGQRQKIVFRYMEVMLRVNCALTTLTITKTGLPVSLHLSSAEGVFLYVSSGDKQFYLVPEHSKTYISKARRMESVLIQ